MVSRTFDTTELISRLGGELKGTNQGFVINNAQSQYKAPSQGSEQQTLNEGNFAGISSTKFDSIVAFFERKGVPKSLARTYGASLLEASITTGKDVTELVQVNSDNKIVFKDDAITHMNIFRPKVSQIGFRVVSDSIENDLIERAMVP